MLCVTFKSSDAGQSAKICTYHNFWGSYGNYY